MPGSPVYKRVREMASEKIERPGPAAAVDTIDRAFGHLRHQIKLDESVKSKILDGFVKTLSPPPNTGREGLLSLRLNPTDCPYSKTMRGCPIRIDSNQLGHKLAFCFLSSGCLNKRNRSMGWCERGGPRRSDLLGNGVPVAVLRYTFRLIVIGGRSKNWLKPSS